MAEIVIRIQVPDGVNVRVEQGDAKPFVERPAPAFPKNDPVCPEHGAEWKLVPAGFSKKTNRQYSAFWACPVRGCNEKPDFDAPGGDEPYGGSDYDSLPF